MHAQIALGGLRESGSVFARKENHFIGEEGGDCIQREVGEFDLRPKQIHVLLNGDEAGISDDFS